MMDPFNIADRATGGPRKSAWARLSSSKRNAWKVLIGAGAIGVLGVPIFSVILNANGVPGTKDFLASFWLLVITLPVALAASVVIYIVKSPPKTSNFYTMIFFAFFAVAGGIVLMNEAIALVGGHLGDFYCFNDGYTHEVACRQYEELGLAPGSPSTTISYTMRAIVATSNARGVVMTLCGIFAGGAAGFLVREYDQSEPA